jgi:hypothetical protein
MPTMFVVTQVRQALQQTAAIGAFSPYFPAAWAIRPVQIVFTGESLGAPLGLSAFVLLPLPVFYRPFRMVPLPVFNGAVRVV